MHFFVALPFRGCFLWGSWPLSAGPSDKGPRFPLSSFISSACPAWLGEIDIVLSMTREWGLSDLSHRSSDTFAPRLVSERLSPFSLFERLISWAEHKEIQSPGQFLWR